MPMASERTEMARQGKKSTVEKQDIKAAIGMSEPAPLPAFSFSLLPVLFKPQTHPMPRVRASHLEPELKAIATEDYTFQNWAKTFSCTCEIMFEPSSESQVVKVCSSTCHLLVSNRSTLNRRRSSGWLSSTTNRSKCLEVVIHLPIWPAREAS